MRILKLYANELYNSQHTSSQRRGHPPPAYLFSEFYEFLMKSSFREMVIHYLESEDDDRKPSVDRLDPEKPYTLENIELVTWIENQRRHHEYRKKNPTQSKPIQQWSLNGDLVQEFTTIKSAARAVNRTAANIRKAAQTQGKCAGYLWVYV